MADTPAECTMLAQLIAAHESALEQAALLQAQRQATLDANGIHSNGTRSNGTRANGSHASATRANALDPAESAPGQKRDKTTSGNLLRRAVAALGVEAIAGALCVAPPALEEFMRSGRTMTLAQQRTFALALITLSEHHPNLRRRAIGLLGQVRAAEDFQAGVTERHLDTPPRNHEWR